MISCRLPKELGLPSSLPRLLIVGTALLLAVLPSWSAEKGESAQSKHRVPSLILPKESAEEELEERVTRRQGVFRKLREASETLDPDPDAKLLDKVKTAQRLVGTVNGEDAVVPALRAFLEAVRKKLGQDGSVTLQLPEGDLTIEDLHKALQ